MHKVPKSLLPPPPGDETQTFALSVCTSVKPLIETKLEKAIINGAFSHLNKWTFTFLPLVYIMIGEK